MEQFKIFIQSVAEQAYNEARGLPPGVDEMLDVLENSPDLVKGGLTFWLNQKVADTTALALQAEENGDQAESDRLMARVDRYQAFFTCINGDCTALNQLKASGNWPSPSAAASPPSPPPAAAQSQPVTGPEGSWFCCQWTHPVFKTQTCAPSRDRANCSSLPNGSVFENADCRDSTKGPSCVPRP
jgi:hypothetical protein